VSPQPSLLQAEQLQPSQPVLTAEVFYPSDHFCGLHIQLQKPSHNYLGHIAENIYIHIYVSHNECLVLILLIGCGCMSVKLWALCREELNEEKMDS